jgi:DNA-binding transcriptional LysR family regulator
MELRDVKTFLTLSEELHFGRTADRLGITRGRVSQTIRALEREVGAALFERTSRRVRLTPVGERFRAGAERGYQELLTALRDSRAAARDIGGRLRVGYPPTMGGDFAAAVAAAFEKRHPECTVMLSAVDTSLTPMATLDSTDAEVVLVWSPGGDGRALQTPGLRIGPVLAHRPRGTGPSRAPAEPDAYGQPGRSRRVRVAPAAHHDRRRPPRPVDAADLHIRTTPDTPPTT